jgi:DNA-binding transcriptional LysR family regulator
MDHAPQDLLSLRMFALAVASRSFSGAARALGVDVSTVTRAIARLESELGAKLVLRSTAGLALTEAGRLYHAHAERTLAEDARIRAAIRTAGDAQSGTLRVSMPVFVAQHIVPLIVSPFVKQYPQAQLDIHASDERVDLLASAFDLAVRQGPLPDSTLHAQRIVAFRRVTCASPEWLSAHGTPEHPKDLNGLPCLSYGNGPTPARWTFHDGTETSVVTVSPVLRTNNLDTLLALAEQGLGIVRLPSWVVGRSLATGKLVSVLGAWEPTRPGEELALYGLYPDDPGKAKLRAAFLAALVTAASHDPTAESTPRRT